MDISNGLIINWTVNPTTKPDRTLIWTYPKAFNSMVVGFSWMDINKGNLDYPPELQEIPTITSCTLYCDRTGGIQSTGYYIFCLGY